MENLEGYESEEDVKIIQQTPNLPVDNIPEVIPEVKTPAKEIKQMNAPKIDSKEFKPTKSPVKEEKKVEIVEKKIVEIVEEKKLVEEKKQVETLKEKKVEEIINVKKEEPAKIEKKGIVYNYSRVFF